MENGNTIAFLYVSLVHIHWFDCVTCRANENDFDILTRHELLRDTFGRKVYSHFTGSLLSLASRSQTHSQSTV